jgi:hypothetical protein
MELRSEVVSRSSRVTSLHLLGLLVATAFLYNGVLWSEFTFDDLLVVRGNESLRGWDPARLVSEEWGRQVRTLTLMVDYALFGDDPVGYHLHNLLWHSLAVVLVYGLMRRVLERPGLAFVGALLFAVHPIHVDSVANVTNRKELLCAAFSLLSFLAYDRFLREEGAYRWALAAGALGAFVLALFSKEVAVVVPGLLVMHELLLVPPQRRVLMRHPVLMGTVALAGAAGVLGYVFRHIDFAALEQSQTVAGYAGEPSVTGIVLTSSRAFFRYVELLLWPARLCPDHTVNLARSLTEPGTLLAWGGLAGAVGASLWAVRWSRSVAFGLGWVLICWLPVSNLVPTAYILADRYMYLPSVGFCLAFVAAGAALLDRVRSRGLAWAPALAAVLMTVLLSAHAVRTLRTNAYWQSNESLWQFTLSCNPRSWRAYLGLGRLRLLSHFHGEALEYLDRANALEPRNASIRFNRGLTLVAAERFPDAIRDFDVVVEIDPHHTRAYVARAEAFARIGDYESAASDFERAAGAQRD